MYLRLKRLYKEDENFFSSVNIANFFVLILLSVLMYWAHHHHGDSFSWIPNIRLCTIALILYHAFIIRIKRLWIFDFAVVFTVCNYLFVEGYLFIWEQGILRYEYWTMGYSSTQWLKGFVFGLCYIQGMFTGLLLKTKKDMKSHIKNYFKLNRQYTSYRIFLIGLIIFICALPFKFYVDFLTYVVNRSGSGYSAVLSNEVISGVSFNISLLVNVGVIYVISSNYLSKDKAKWFFFLFFAYALGITTLVGGRRFTVTALLAVVPCYLYTYNVRVSWKRLGWFGLIGYLGVVFLCSVSATRESLATSLSDYFIFAMGYLKSADVIFDFIYEFGNTIFPYIMSLEIFPQRHDYMYGLSLLVVWILAIPGAGKIFPNLRHDVGTSTIAKSYYNYWFGGAFGQELFANFGYYSVGIAILIGRFFRYILGTLNRHCLISNARYFTLYYALLNLVRSDVGEFVRLILWSYFLPIVLIQFIKNGKKN